MFGRIIIFDGRNGTVLRWMQTPDRRESYYPPQILTWLDGEQFVLFGTGGNSRSVSRQSYGSYVGYSGTTSLEANSKIVIRFNVVHF